MLCKTCRIMFPFYLKYCRQCGRKLIESGRPPASKLTAELASKPQMEDAGMDLSAYATSPLTMRLGTPGAKMADLLCQVLKSYPSIKTTRLSEQGGGALPLREFSMEEFVAVERTAELTVDEVKDLLCSENSSESSTLELPLMIVADTVPLEVGNEIAEQGVMPPTAVLDESVCELGRTRPLARARLHLRPTGPVVRFGTEGRPLWKRLLEIMRLVFVGLYNYLVENSRFKNR